LPSHNQQAQPCDVCCCAIQQSAIPALPLRLAGKTSRPDLPYQQQLAVGRKVASHFSGMLPALGICEESQGVIEARFSWQLAVLQQHLQQLPYLLSSSSPCIADFGLMGPLYARELTSQGQQRCMQRIAIA
jgi:hypothetical protein